MMKEMNEQAAGRFMDAIMVTTSGADIAANEIYAALPAREGRLAEYAQIWTEECEQLLTAKTATQILPEDVEGITCQVAGSREFALHLMQAQKAGKLVFRHRSVCVWPFSEEKYNFMDVLTAYFINKEIK